MVLCYYIQKQPLRGPLERRCFQIGIESTWQMPVGGFASSRVVSYLPEALLETDFDMGVFQ